MNNLKNYTGRKGEIVRFFRANPKLSPDEVAKRFEENVGNIYLYYKLAHGIGWRENLKLEKRQEGFGGHIKASAPTPPLMATPTPNRVVAYFIDHPNASPDLVAKKFNVAPITVYKMRKLAQEKMAQQVRSMHGDAHLDVEIPITPVSSAIPTTRQKSANATQVGGSHYKEVGVQPWDAMEAWLTREEFIGFLKGNIIKYMARSRLKGGDEDIKKAFHYSDKLNEIVEHTV